MNNLLLGLLCSLAVGCNDTKQPASGTDSPKTITVNRPITPEMPANKVEPADRTNTGVNVRDQNGAEKTPFDQNENKTDIKTTADIRKAVMAAKVSVNGQNVKIITQDGKVTLCGPVVSEQEKQMIEEIAIKIASVEKVDSHLEVNNE